MSNISNQPIFRGKTVDNLTQEELKQALILTYQESHKFKDLYFKVLKAKDEIVSCIIEHKLECLTNKKF